MLAILSQYGEIVDVFIPRDERTGKSKGFAFACYLDQRSTILAVDNLNGSKVLGRIYAWTTAKTIGCEKSLTGRF